MEKIQLTKFQSFYLGKGGIEPTDRMVFDEKAYALGQEWNTTVHGIDEDIQLIYDKIEEIKDGLYSDRTEVPKLINDLAIPVMHSCTALETIAEELEIDMGNYLFDEVHNLRRQLDRVVIDYVYAQNKQIKMHDVFY